MPMAVSSYLQIIGSHAIGLGGKLRPAVQCVQPKSMQRVHQILFGLEPIAIDRAADPRPHARFEGPAGSLPDIVKGKLRQPLQRPHIGEQQSAKLTHRVSRLLDLLQKWIGRRLQGISTTLPSTS